MSADLLDNPLILSILFHPRSAAAGHPAGHIHDGTIPVGDDVLIGYRLHIHQRRAPLILFFHGNGEIAPDYDGIAPLYKQAGASLLVVDYRGYGWSTGKPLTSTMLPDAGRVFEAVPGILVAHELEGVPLFVMGRSLGSAPAIHLAHTYPDAFKGLIIESGFAHVLPLLARLGLPVDMLSGLPDPIGNAHKMQSINLPLLIIHGEKDRVIPFENGQTLYDASPAADKRFKRFRPAGHNDLLYWADEYFDALGDFIQQTGEAD